MFDELSIQEQTFFFFFTVTEIPLERRNTSSVRGGGESSDVVFLPHKERGPLPSLGYGRHGRAVTDDL